MHGRMGSLPVLFVYVRSTQMRICLDFDGVLHDYLHPVPGKKMGPPIDGAHDACWMLTRQGHELTVCTVRIDITHGGDKGKHVIDWLDYFDFPTMPVLRWKPNADVYVDDRGLRFEQDHDDRSGLTAWDCTMVKLRMLGATGGR